MKFGEKFGVQAVFKETLPDSNDPDCSKPNLFSCKSRENKFRLYSAFPIPGGEEDDGQKHFRALCGGRAVPTTHPITPSLFPIRLAATALGDPRCMVCLGLFMGCVAPTLQLQEWWTDPDLRDEGTASLGAPRHDVIPSVDLFVI